MKKVLPFLVSLLFFSACGPVGTSSSRTSPQKKFGDDAHYFLALQAAEKGDEAEAQRLLKISRKKGSPLISKRSAESLTLLGSVTDRIEAAVFLADNFDDESSLTTACRELFQHGEYARIISLTEEISLENSKNELVKLRLQSLAQKKDSRFDSEFYRWFISRPLSSDHIETYKIYTLLLQEKNQNILAETEKFQKNLNKRSLLESQLAPDYQESSGTEPLLVPEGGFESLLQDLDEAANPEKTVIDYRILIYHRSYIQAFSQIDSIFKIYENRGEEIGCQLLSDIGKAALYGTSDYFSSARKFDKIATGLTREKAYFAFFYAARLYDKAGRYPRQTVSRFRSALESTDDALQFDNCLWYLLNFQLRTSTDDIISTLTEYGARIHDPDYFDDFFESLSILLLSSHRWQDFYKVWKKTNSNFSESTAGKYAYISGRLIEEGLADGDAGLKTRQAVDAFTKVLNSGASLYYKVCAMERLNVTDPKLVESYLLRGGEEESVNSDGDSARLIEGYALFGFPQRMYTEWLAQRKNLSMEDSVKISAFLSSCAQMGSDNSYNIQSLRIADRTFNNLAGEATKELLLLDFPRFYESLVTKACKEFELPEHLLYALIRSESFFDANATSKAGANGLTQLMEATADDEAKKLKIGSDGNYDILDPETNIRMGAHYLASLISRTEDNNKLLAIYAYNAGLANVRSWGVRFKKDWAETGKPARRPVGISMDLFLESLPFAETRQYGRNVIAASALYAYLYENKPPAETVREIMY